MIRQSAAQFVAGDLRFPEGPAFGPDGALRVVDLEMGAILRLAEPPIRFVVETPIGGRPNGLAFHRDGSLYVADAGRKSILCVERAGGIRTITTECVGAPLRGPNDLVFDEVGGLYFSDPAGSSRDHPDGRVVYADTTGRTMVAAEGLAFPNGLALDAHRQRLYVAETRTQRILVFSVQAPGCLRSPRVFAEVGGAWGPDGLALDIRGRLFVAMYATGTVLALSPEGASLFEISVPGPKVTNLAFGGPDRCWLYITEAATGGVYRTRLDTPGQPEYGLAAA
jgi:sugar lactone lactonase YvrE